MIQQAESHTTAAVCSVLVVTPRKREANLIRATLDRAGISACALGHGVDPAGTWANVLLVDEKCLDDEQVHNWLKEIDSDPRHPASLIVLARRRPRHEGNDGAGASNGHRVGHRHAAAVLERPLRPLMLVSTVKSCLALQRTQQEIQSQIRARREQERRLNDQREMLRVITDVLPVLICYVDTAERCKFASPACRGWFGAEASDLIGRGVREVWGYPYAAVRPHLVAALAGRPQDFEIQLDFPAAGLRCVRIQVVPHVDEDAVVKGLFLLISDMTARREAERAALENQQRFAAFMDNLPGAAWVKDPDGRYVYANAEAQRIFSRSLESIIGRSDEQLFDAETSQQFRENDCEAMRATGPIQAVEILRQADGVEHHSIVNKFAIPGPDGEAAGIGGVAFDITDRLAAEDALRHSERRHRELIEALPAAICICDAQGRIVLHNRAAEEIWGRSPRVGVDQWCGSSKILRPDGTPLPLEEYPTAVAVRQRRAVRDLDIIIERPDGSRRHVLPHADPLLDPSGAVVGVVNMLLDITSRKHSEEELSRYHELLEQLVEERTRELERSHAQLRLSERMAALGTLSAGLGHDMGNLLLPVRLRLEAMEGKGIPQNLREDIVAIGKCADYLQRLANGLRLFALDPEESGGQPHRTELRDWWSDVESFLRNVLPRNVELDRDFGEELAPVAMPRHRLTQAVFNLVQNSGNAMRGRESGRVLVWAERGPDERTIRIGVTDNGPGMTPEVRARCLEPFFTTSTRSISTGLGLSLVHGIVTKAGGHIAIESEPGRGATFIMTLPVVEPPPPGHVDSTMRAVVSGLDARTGSYVSAVLQPLGYQVGFDAGPDGQNPHLWVTVADEARYAEAEAFAVGAPGRRAVVFGHKPDGRPVPQVVCFSKVPAPSLVRETLRLVSAELVSELKDANGHGGCAYSNIVRR